MTTTHPDLSAPARRMAELVAGVPDDRLDAPTPCTDYTVGDLLDHIAGLTLAFSAAARKEPGAAGTPPPGDRTKLLADWRTRIPADLDELVVAWSNPDAWSGMTRAGGIDMPGEIAGIVAIEELVAHGWDLAKGTGQSFTVDDESADLTIGFYEQFSGPDSADQRGDAYGPVNRQPATASKLDQLIGLSGRDPGWSPPA